MNYYFLKLGYITVVLLSIWEISEWVSEWLLFNANSAIFHLYPGENKLIFNEMMIRWNISPRINMSLHSNTLFWFRANQYLLYLLNAACLTKKQQIPIL